MTNERDPSMFYNISGDFAHTLQYFKAGHLPRRDIRKQEVSSPGKWHPKHKIHVSPFIGHFQWPGFVSLPKASVFT
jgi:hypothetical protein